MIDDTYNYLVPYFKGFDDSPLNRSDFFAQTQEIDTMSREQSRHLRRSFSATDVRETEHSNTLNTTEKFTKKGARYQSVENMYKPIGEPPKKFISMAEHIKNFQLNTPLRFRTVSRLTTNQKNNCTIPFKPLTLTHAKSPTFLTKTRNRPVHVLSYEEREEIELMELRKKQFKANEISKKLFEGPTLGVTVTKKPNTKPEPFKLTEVKKKVITSPKAPKCEFTARPVPTNILERVVGVKKSEPAPLTLPKTPLFMVKSKLRMTRTVFNDENGHLEQVPLCHQGVGMQKPLGKTIVKPFSFEKRDIEMLTKKEEKLKKMIAEESKSRQFHAKPVPKFLNCTITCADNFSSRTSTSSNEENKQPGATFKARPASVLHKKPFVPVKQERPLVEVSEFDLNTDKRVKKWQEYERIKKEKEANLEKIRQEHEHLLEKKEEEEIQRLRQEIVHKPLPLRVHKTIDIKTSNKPLTIPQSPAFSKRISKQS